MRNRRESRSGTGSVRNEAGRPGLAQSREIYHGWHRLYLKLTGHEVIIRCCTLYMNLAREKRSQP